MIAHNTSQFFSTHFNHRIAAAVRSSGYDNPTPIQEKAIPVVLEGRDILALAQTGTGKTAAFILPIIQNLEKSPLGKISTLIIAPTRELADQIHANIKTFTKGTKIRSVTIYGAVSMNHQIQVLGAGCDIVVGCPGRLLDHIQRRSINLSALKYLVLDEADHMFDMGFLPNIRQILKSLPVQKQSMLFSATMPREIRGLALDILKNPVSIQVNPGTPTSTVTHSIYPVQSQLKPELTIELLKQIPTGSVLIFCRTKHRVKRFAKLLQDAGHNATSLQGNSSQSQRRDAMSGFRSGKYRIMVATDIAARGIDVSSVSHVINFDIPGTVESYTHRIGRTGRAARTGDAFTLVTDEDHSMVRSIERVLGDKLERRYLDGFNYKRAATNPQSNASVKENRQGSRGRQGSDRPRRIERTREYSVAAYQ